MLRHMNPIYSFSLYLFMEDQFLYGSGIGNTKERGSEGWKLWHSDTTVFKVINNLPSLIINFYIMIFIKQFTVGAITLLPHCRTDPSGPMPPLYRGLRHTTLGGTSLGRWSDRRRYRYVATYNTHKRQTSMPPARYERTNPASERPQTHVLLRPHGHWDRHPQ